MMTNISMPAPPERAIEFDFRATPTRLTAVAMYAGGYELWEIDPRSGQKTLHLQSHSWAEVYAMGRRLADA